MYVTTHALHRFLHLVLLGGLSLGTTSNGDPPSPQRDGPVPLFTVDNEKGAEREAAAPTVKGPDGNRAPWMVELKVVGAPQGSALLWQVYVRDKTSGQFFRANVQTRIVKSERALIFSGPVGQYEVEVNVVKGEDSTPLLWRGEITGDVPVPPGPTPPTPPAPEPKTENPFGAAPGLRVMVVYETMDDAKRPLGEYLVLRGQKFREYLDSNCVADGYRIVDKDAKAVDPAAWYAVGLKRTDRKTLPWLYVGKEASGLSTPLPKDPDEAIKVIDKFLGK